MKINKEKCIKGTWQVASLELEGEGSYSNTKVTIFLDNVITE